MADHRRLSENPLCEPLLKKVQNAIDKVIQYQVGINAYEGIFLQMQEYTKLKCGCIIVVCIAILISIFKMVLLMARYSIKRVTCILNKTVDVDGNILQIYHSLPDPIHVEYVFTVVMYAIVSILRLAEYVVLATAIWNFLSNKEFVRTYVHTYKKNRGKVTKFVFKWLIVLCPYLLLGITVPIFGILQELEYDKKVSLCHTHTEAVYLAYSAVNFLRYFCAFSVRMALIITTVVIREIWKVEEKELESTTPNDNLMAENGNHERVLADWSKTTTRLHHWTKGYRKTGDTVKGIVSVFQTWYMIPWVIFFIASSLDVKRILQPWSDDSIMAQIYYLLYSINQLVTLLVPFLFATFINVYHHEFYKCMKKDLLYGCESASQQAFAHMQFNIEKEEEFDFVARIPCTGITIHVDSPLYVLFLLLGLFFTVCSTLF